MKALVGTFNQGFTCLYRVEAELDPVSCYTLAGLAANCQSPPQLFIAAACTPAHAGCRTLQGNNAEPINLSRRYRAFQGRQTIVVIASRYSVAKSRNIQCKRRKKWTEAVSPEFGNFLAPTTARAKISKLRVYSTDAFLQRQSMVFDPWNGTCGICGKLL